MKEIKKLRGTGGFYGHVVFDIGRMLAEKTNNGTIPLTPELEKQILAENKDEYLMLVFNSSQTVKKELNKKLPGILVTDPAVKAEKEKLRVRLCKKMYSAELRRKIELAKEPVIHDRSLHALFYWEDSEAAREKNERFRQIMTNGTQEEKKEYIAARLEEIGNQDFSAFDLTNDQFVVDNYEKLYKARSLSDSENFIKLANTYGIDLSEPRFEHFNRNAAVMSPLWAAIGVKTEAICSPLYSEVDFAAVKQKHVEPIRNASFGLEDSAMTACLRNHADYLVDNVPYHDGERALADKSIPSPEERYAKSAEVTGDVFGLVAKMKERAANPRQGDDELRKPHTDFPDMRLHTALYSACDSLLCKSDADYGQTKKMRIARVLKICEMQNLHDTATNEKDGYSPEMIDAAAKKLADNPDFDKICSRFTEQEIDDIAHCKIEVIEHLSATTREQIERFKILRKNNIPEPELNTNHEPMPDKNVNPHDYYLRKLNDNIDIIRQYDPTFTMTEKEKEAMVSPERIAMHQRASALVKGRGFFNGRTVRSQFDGAVPAPFARLPFFLVKRSGSTEDAAYNSEMFAMVPSGTAEGDAYRKNFLVEIMNKANSVDPEMLGPGHTEQEKFEFCMANYDIFQIQFELTNITNNLDAGLGFGFSPEGARKYEAQKRYLADVSAAGMGTVDIVADESFLTFPQEKLLSGMNNKAPGAQDLLVLMTSDKNKKFGKNISNTILSQMGSDSVETAISAKNTGNGIKHYSAADLEDKAPVEERVVDSVPNLREKFRTAYNTLKDADNFYNLRNSGQYRELLTSLKNAVSFMDKMDESVRDNEKEALYNAITSVSEAAANYSKYAEPLEKNENRQIRFDTAAKLYHYCSIILWRPSSSEDAPTFATDRNFNRFLRENARAYEKNILGMAENYYTKENLSEQEEIFNRGVGKTNSEREKIATFPENSTERRAQETLVEARDRLTALIGREKTDPAEVRLLMAKVVTCSQLVANGQVPDLSQEAVDQAAATVAANKNFIALTKKTDSDTINRFLGANGAEALTAKYTRALNAQANNHRQNNRVVEDPQDQFNMN